MLQQLRYLATVYPIHGANLIEHFEAEHSLFRLLDWIGFYQPVADDMQNLHLILQQ